MIYDLIIALVALFLCFQFANILMHMRDRWNAKHRASAGADPHVLGTHGIKVGKNGKVQAESQPAISRIASDS